MRLSDWSSDVCTSDLPQLGNPDRAPPAEIGAHDDHALLFHLVDKAADAPLRAAAISAAENLVVRAGFAAHRGARDLEERRDHLVWQPVGGRQRVPPARIGGDEPPAPGQFATAAEGGTVSGTPLKLPITATPPQNQAQQRHWRR